MKLFTSSRILFQKANIHTHTEHVPNIPSIIQIPVNSNCPPIISATPVLGHSKHQSKIPIAQYDSLDQLNLKKLEKNLNASFRRTLDAKLYWKRLDKSLAKIIIAGKNYEGATIVTKEICPVSGKEFFYLDKFAVKPTAQGFGLSDMMWKELVANFSDFFWRSRDENPVNKWYFRHSELSFKMALSSKKNPEILKEWVSFAVGPRRLEFMPHYRIICRSIPESFH